MKILKTAAQHNIEMMNRETANIGCDKCPCCGETKSFETYAREGILNKGLSRGIVSNPFTIRIGLFKTKLVKKDFYSCRTCGAQWESEPYEV